MLLVQGLFGIAVLFVLLAVASAFVCTVGGGTLFDQIGLHLVAIIVVFVSASFLAFAQLRRAPQSWLFRSPWPTAVVMGAWGLVTLYLVSGVLIAV